MHTLFITAYIALQAFLVSAAPIPSPLLGFGDLSTRSSNSTQATVPVSNATIEATLVRPAEFSRLAYCPSTAVISGAANVFPEAEVLAAGGDDGLIPFCALHLLEAVCTSLTRLRLGVDFIIHDTSTQSIVVAHQGTNTSNIISIANDVELALTNLNTTLFPNAPSGVQVHDGFQLTFGRTSDSILSGVKSALASTGVNKVLVTGHSLGAAIATMDALMLRLNLPATVEMTTTVFGLPRGGNQVYANFIDATHSAGEIHIQAVDANTGDATSVVSCPGQENVNCIDGNNPLADSTANHIGMSDFSTPTNRADWHDRPLF
ncbi:hypothetical protein HWV62_21900 [Athelia sp. TMB]|nr:hypothetical protein HWV62_21900 [Athelia sp. TMB]